LTSTRSRTTLKIAQTLRADHGRISVSLSSDSSDSRFIQSLNQPGALSKSFLAAMLDAPGIWG
jgi:hypothetical protein